MLNKFNSNVKKLNRVTPKINPNNLNDDLYITGSLLNIELPTENKFNSNTKSNPNPTRLVNNANTVSDLTGSLLNIEIPTIASHQSHTKSNPNPTRLVNNKNTISDFHNEIFIHSARYIRRRIDAFSDNANTLTIYNAVTDYGTEGASANNFEVIVGGLHIPSDYVINDVGNTVVITLGGRYIDFENTILDDIYVIGKLINV
jgi:hypothetical protein